jgi:pyruvate-ferredoxin/flavodoxin oxidoreductase
LSAIAKFASNGKTVQKKDLGLMLMSYGTVYVASVAMGAKDDHTLKTFLEAEAFDGPSIIIAYSHCIAHGIDMSNPLQNQKAAVDSGQWLLYRYNPDNVKIGKNPLSLDSKDPKMTIADYMNMESRFKILFKTQPEMAKANYKQAQINVDTRYKYFKYLADRKFEGDVEK